MLSECLLLNLYPSLFACLCLFVSRYVFSLLASQKSADCFFCHSFIKKLPFSHTHNSSFFPICFSGQSSISVQSDFPPFRVRPFTWALHTLDFSSQCTTKLFCCVDSFRSALLVNAQPNSLPSNSFLRLSIRRHSSLFPHHRRNHMELRVVFERSWRKASSAFR